MPRFAIGQDVWVLYCLGKICLPPRLDIDPPDAFEVVSGRVVSYRSDENSYEVKLDGSSMAPAYKEFEISASEKEAKGRLEAYYNSLAEVYTDIVGYIKQSKQRHCGLGTAKENVFSIGETISMLTWFVAALLFILGFHEWALGIAAAYCSIRLFMELYDDPLY